MTTVPNMPAFADPDSAARPLHVVPQDGLQAWLDAQPPQWAAWLRDGAFGAGLGEVALLPGMDGAVVGAVVGLGDARARARQRFGLARAVSALPAGLAASVLQAEASLRGAVAQGL